MGDIKVYVAGRLGENLRLEAWGNTYPYRQLLKSLGFKFVRKSLENPHWELKGDRETLRKVAKELCANGITVVGFCD